MNHHDGSGNDHDVLPACAENQPSPASVIDLSAESPLTDSSSIEIIDARPPPANKATQKTTATENKKAQKKPATSGMY